MAEVQQPQAQAQAQAQPQPQPQQASSGGTFEAQETMQGDGVAQAPVETPPQPAETPVMEEGGEVEQKQDGLDWGLVFTFFDFRDE